MPRMRKGERFWHRVRRVRPGKLANWLVEQLTRSARTLHWHMARVYLSCLESFGLIKGLPPGSLSGSSLHGAGGRDFYTHKHHLFGPIFKLFWPSRRLKVCVVGFPRARRLLTAHSDVLVPVSVDITSIVPKGFLRCMVGAEHSRYRRLFKDGLRGDLVGAWNSELRFMLISELTELSVTASQSASPQNRTTRAIDRFSTRALLAILFGVLPRHPEFETLNRALEKLGPEGLVHPIGPDQVAAIEEIRATVLALLTARSDGAAKSEHETLLDRLGTSIDASQVDPTMIGNAIYMLEMGRHDVRGLLRWLLKYLSDNPSFAKEVFDCGPGSDAGQRMAEACVLETLRLDQAEALNRRATAEFIFEGHRIPRDSHVAVLLRESHLNPDAFDDAQRFDPHRFVSNSFTSDEYAPFGIGAHRCIAADIVVQLGALFVLELVRGFTWSVIADGPRHHGGYHWEPSPLFAVTLLARDAWAGSDAFS
jgi:cytochrome P450